MASVAVDTPLAEALSTTIHQRIVEESWTTEDDTALAEYIVLMLANGKTQDQVAAELAGELLQDAHGTEEFAKWLFEQVAALSGTQASEQPTSASCAEAPEQPAEPAHDTDTVMVPAAYEADMGDGAPDNAPKGPRGMHNSKGTRGGRGAISKPDSTLHRTQGNDRINSHMRGAPKGPRNIQNAPVRPGMQKALNGLMGQPQLPQMPMLQNNGMQPGLQMGSLSPEQQMQYMQMFEQQAQMMAQMMQMNQSMSNGNRSLFDRVERGRGGNRGARRTTGSQNGTSRPQADGEQKDGEIGSDGQQPPQPVSHDPFTIMCKFNTRCTNASCPYVHQSPTAPLNTPVDMSQTCSFGVACKSQNRGFDAYSWTPTKRAEEKEADHLSDRKFVDGDAGPEELVKPDQNGSTVKEDPTTGIKAGPMPSRRLLPKISLRTASQFKVVEHTINCAHTREYAAATAFGDSDQPQLAVKQYIPLDNLKPSTGDVTLIGAHANGFPKELYEPLWEELNIRSAKKGFRIRSIWIADFWSQGQSGIMNETILGHEHPVIQLRNGSIEPAVLSTPRRDLWPSKEAAVEKFKKSKFYQTWDTRVLDRWIEYGLRRTPTELYPRESDDQGADDQRVTLTTSKHQELFTFLKPTYLGDPTDRFPDLDPAADLEFPGYPFYRAEPAQVFKRLPEMRPSVLYVFGGKSSLSPERERKAKMEQTGTGVGGSGGARAGRVQEVVLHDCGHLVAMQDVKGCADAIALFLERELSLWKSEKKAFDDFWVKKPRRERITIDERWTKQHYHDKTCAMGEQEYPFSFDDLSNQNFQFSDINLDNDFNPSIDALSAEDFQWPSHDQLVLDGVGFPTSHSLARSNHLHQSLPGSFTAQYTPQIGDLISASSSLTGTNPHQPQEHHVSGVTKERASQLQKEEGLVNSLDLDATDFTERGAALAAPLDHNFARFANRHRGRQVAANNAGLPRRRSRYARSGGMTTAAIPIPPLKNSTALDPMQRWQESPPEDEPVPLSATYNAFRSLSSSLPTPGSAGPGMGRPTSRSMKRVPARPYPRATSVTSLESVASTESKYSADSARSFSSAASQTFRAPPVHPTIEHLETHNYEACYDATGQGRTFKRKDHLVQHLRLVHAIVTMPLIEEWKLESSPVISRCGWHGEHGFDPEIAARVRHAMPPYLIGAESQSLIPFSATNRGARDHFAQISSQISQSRDPSTIESGDVQQHQAFPSGGTEPGTLQPSTNTEAFTDLLMRHLSRYAHEQEKLGIRVTNEMFQEESRRVLYSCEDSWNQTVADNPEWLVAFRRQHGFT
ncbi:hypothetical protein DV738_g1163, partial [Chaetothyriales sp. CBS 135597]